MDKRTLRITKRQYRAFAEIAKAHGIALNLSTYTHMGCWGEFSPFALLICQDATDPDSCWEEQAQITLANSIDIGRLRAAGPLRPELDWSQLEDHEIYPFVLWHEIGHRMDNVDGIDVMLIKDIEVRNKCVRRLRFINEVLADRYAWNKIRPGERFVRTDTGKCRESEIDEAIEYLRAHVKHRSKYTVRPLHAGQYRDVPDYMLATPQRAAFLGRGVAPKLLERRMKHYREYAAQGCKPLY
ncbi:hypothetical protein [Paraburkholderia sp.]|uniref:hypothetical protein n=1 Tax=Paraburkholderia sp. TaxID=1926495 RepID=UPI0039E6833B